MEKGLKLPGQKECRKQPVLMLASVASMIDQFNLPNIRLMQTLGYEVHVCCNFAKGNTCDKKRVQKLVRLLVGMRVICHQWDCPRKFSVRGCYRAYCQLMRLTKRYPFAWMHCHSPIGGALARIVAYRRSIPVIYTAHGFHFYKGAPLFCWLLFYPVEKLLSYHTDVLLTVNQEDYQLAKRKLSAAKTRKLPGAGIDTGYFGKERCKNPQMEKKAFCKRYGLPADAKLLLSVGELSRRKNHQLVIAMLPELPPSVCYVICGKGAMYARLTALARKKGVAGRVCFLGYVEDVRKIYAYADLFVFPSVQEGLPVALLEAMASGIPCLVSDIRGSRELVRIKSGRFKPGNGADFLRKAEALLSNTCLREQNCKEMKKQAARYDSRAVSAKMLQIYKGMGAD